MTIAIDGVWRLDPERSSVEFHVRHFYGLMTVKGRFARYDGTLQLNGRNSVELVIDADSLDTKLGKRDEHLRSADFFDIANYPQVRFESDDAALTGDTLKVRGRLTAAGRSIPLGVDRRLVACASCAVQMIGSMTFIAAAGSSTPVLWLGIALFGIGFGNSTSLPPLQRATIWTFRPSDQPNCSNASKNAV